MSLFCFYFLFLYTHLILIAHFYKRTDELLQISPLMIHISLPVTRGLPRVKKKKTEGILDPFNQSINSRSWSLFKLAICSDSLLDLRNPMS